MRNKKAIYFFILAAVFSLLSAKAIWQTIATYEPVVRYDNPIMVVTAAKEIQPYTPLSSDQFKFAEIPQSMVPKDAVTDPEELRGKATRALVLGGDIVRAGHLTEAGGSTNTVVSSLSALNDPQMRAAYAPLPKGISFTKGDRVNIIHTKSEKGSSEVTAETILNNILVLESSNESVYLSLSQKQAERLVKAMAEGQIAYTISPVHSTLRLTGLGE